MKDILGLIHEFITTNSSMSRNALADLAEELGETCVAKDIRSTRMWEITVYIAFEGDSRRYSSQLRFAKEEELKDIAHKFAIQEAKEKSMDWPIHAECYPYYVNESTGEIVQNTHPQFYPVRFTFDE